MCQNKHHFFGIAPRASSGVEDEISTNILQCASDCSLTACVPYDKVIARKFSLKMNGNEKTEGKS